MGNKIAFGDALHKSESRQLLKENPTENFDFKLMFWKTNKKRY